jgi:hypothetical protein
MATSIFPTEPELDEIIVGPNSRPWRREQIDQWLTAAAASSDTSRSS